MIINEFSKRELKLISASLEIAKTHAEQDEIKIIDSMIKEKIPYMLKKLYEEFEDSSCNGDPQIIGNFIMGITLCVPFDWSKDKVLEFANSFSKSTDSYGYAQDRGLKTPDKKELISKMIPCPCIHGKSHISLY